LKLCDLDFIGWKFVEAQFPESDVYRLTGIRIARKNGIISKSSEIYVDNLLQYAIASGLTPNLSDKNIRIYPNPAPEVIFVETGERELPLLQLYSLNSILLKTAIANKIAVSEFAHGTYLLKVKTKTGEFGKVVMLSR
jgi:hypothetical protein